MKRVHDQVKSTNQSGHRCSSEGEGKDEEQAEEAKPKETRRMLRKKTKPKGQETALKPESESKDIQSHGIANG